MQVIYCSQGSECFCAAVHSSVCHKIFITNQGKQANKNICFTRDSSMKGCCNSKKHQVNLSYALMLIMYCCLKNDINNIN